MIFRKPPAPLPRRHAFEFKAWPPSISGEGNGVWVAIFGLIVLAIMAVLSVNGLAKADMKLTVNMVQAEPETPERPPTR